MILLNQIHLKDIVHYIVIRNILLDIKNFIIPYLKIINISIDIKNFLIP